MPDGKDLASLIARVRRRLDEQRQMRERFGPFYDRATERSRIMSAAWRAAGSPARLMGAHIDGEYTLVVYALWKREHKLVKATLEQVDAWLAWSRERERLRSAWQG